MILGFAFKNTNTCWTNVSIFLLLLLLLIVVHSGPIYALQGSNLTNKEVNRLIWTGIMILCSPILFCRLNQDTSFSENMEEKSLVLLKCTNKIRFPLNLLEKLEEKKKKIKKIGDSIYPTFPYQSMYRSTLFGVRLAFLFTVFHFRRLEGSID